MNNSITIQSTSSITMNTWYLMYTTTEYTYVN